MLLGEYHYEGGRKFVEHRYTVKNVIFFSPYFWGEGKHTLLPAFAFAFVFVFVILVFLLLLFVFSNCGGLKTHFYTASSPFFKQLFYKSLSLGGHARMPTRK